MTLIKFLLFLLVDQKSKMAVVGDRSCSLGITFNTTEDLYLPYILIIMPYLLKEHLKLIKIFDMNILTAVL
jgi:hypothetical protein